MRKRLFGLTIVFTFAAMALRLVAVQSAVGPYAGLCQLVASKIYLSDQELGSWLPTCLKRAKQMPKNASREQVAEDLRGLFSMLHVSHLDLYNANDSKRIWTGENEETGIESEFVDGELVIFNVQPNSPASDAGLRRGDIIVAIQGSHPAPSLVRAVGGEYSIRRLRHEFVINLEPRPITIDERPVLTKRGEWSILKIPSFRAEFFDRRKWVELAAEMKSSKLILVDLRGNAGGNFVAGLRFLSPFMCAEQEIGYLIKPKSKRGLQAPLVDDLRDERQLQIIDGVDIVQLQTFADYGCLAARVEILIDSGTASTAEMVAQALRDYMGARILGTSSSGQLLVGVWYDVPEFESGWKLSIPEAVFQTRRGRRLEGAGVRVDRELYYDLVDLQAGKDSWIVKTIGDFGRDRLRRVSITENKKHDSASVDSQ